MTYLEIDRPISGVARLTLDRPEKKNALSVELRNEISDALDSLAVDQSVRCVVITGAGDVFCSGFDLSEFSIDTPGFQELLWSSSDRYHRTVLTFPLPMLAAVNGPALAGGFDLSVMCDIRVATSTARFAHVEHSFGPVVFGPLHDLIGGSMARDLTMTGRSIDADRAERIGLVSAVAAPDQFDDLVTEFATNIVRANREHLADTKAKALARAGFHADAPTLEL